MATVDRESPLCLGREAELARLLEGLGAAVAGRGELVLLSGDPGIGKTRLAEVVAGAAPAMGADAIWGRCWEAGGAPAYWPWTEALRGLVTERDAQALAALAPAAARQAARLVPELAGQRGAVEEDPEDARFALFDGVAELLLAAARERPLLLILEDLHAADPSSLLLLDLLGPRLAGAPLCVLATQRRGDPATDQAVEALLGRLERRGETLTLRGLAPEATRALAAHGSQRELSDAAAAALQERTEGNPFFVLSLARVLDEGRERVAPQPLPAGVRDAIARRLAPLSEGTRTALAAGAVLGRGFALARLARLRGVEPGDALALLGPAVRAGLITEGAGPGELYFSHGLIRDWLYAELDPVERAELHRREADRLEGEAGRDARLLPELAHHRTAAVAVAGAGPAVDACERAARGALEELAFEDAAALYERALTLAERHLEALEPSRHAALLLALGDARQRAGDSDGARAAFVRCANLARASELPEQLAQAALGFGAIVVNPGGTDETLVALLEQALEVLPEERTVLRSNLLGRLARELHFRPDTRRPRLLAAQAVELAEASGDPGSQAAAFHAWHVAHAVPELVDERAAVAGWMVQRARAAGERELELSGWVLGAVDQLELGRPDSAAELLHEAELLAQRLRQPALTWRVLLVRGTLALLAGRFDEAERVIAQARTLGSARGRSAFRYWVLQQSELLFLRGGYERIEEDVRALSEEAPEVWGGAHSHLLAMTGRLDEARLGFERQVADDFGGPIDDMAALPQVSRSADVCWALGDAERAPRIYELLLPHADRWLVFAGGLCTGTVRQRLGTLAATMGDHERAVAHLEAATAAHRQAGAGPITAIAEAELARSLRAMGQGARADELLGHALRTARALGMRPLLERIERPDEQARETPRVEACLAREGDVWVAEFAGSEARLRDRKGIGYLARLLERPHMELAALELAGGNGATGWAAGDAGELLDEQAKRAYRRRVDELREEIDEAERWNDGERAAQASAELDRLLSELTRAVGLGGRDRRAASNAERARLSVTRAIRSAIEAIAEQHEELGRHLDASVRTGSHCRYAPAAGEEVSWRVQRD